MADEQPAPRPVTSARVFRLGEEPNDDLSATTTAEERLEMVATLSRRMWELTGRPFPTYERARMPGRDPSRVGLLTTITGVPTFGTAWTERVEHVVRGLRVPFLGRATLLRNKRASGRRKDLADVEALGEDPDAPPGSR